MTAAKPLTLRERNKLRTRTEIHAAALEVFDEDGFSESSLENVAKVAGTSKGTVYSYFPNGIGDIYREIYVSLSDDLLEQARVTREGKTAPVERIEALADALFDLAARPIHGRFFCLISPMLSPVLAPVLGRGSRVYAGMIAEDIALMRPEGQACPEDAHLAELIVGSMREAARVITEKPGWKKPLSHALTKLLLALEAQIKTDQITKPDRPGTRQPHMENKQ